jgi:hypothetical protein
MKKAVSGFLIALTLVFFATGAGAGTDKTQTPPKAPEGYIVVEEDVAIVLSDEHEHYFKKAHQAFLKKNNKTTAADIRKAVAFLKLDAAVAAGEGKKALSDSVNELEKLADDTEKGKVASAKVLEQAFSRADYALAKAYQLKASESWVKKATREVGHSLKTAADNLEYGLAWAGHKAEAGGKAAIKDARLVAGKLIEGMGWVPDEVGKGIEFIGKEVEKFGKQVEPPKS